MLTTGLPFGDRMVLQRQMDIRVWGTAEPRRTITVELGSGVTAEAVVTADGTWSAVLPPQEAARGLRLRVTDGSDTAQFDDVAIGEVWLLAASRTWNISSSSTPTAKRSSTVR